MLQLPLGLIVEGSVAVLLLVTIGYCMVLNRRLKKLHADRDILRKMVLDLVKSTDLANSAIRELKTAALEADTTLSGRLEEAERVGLEIKGHVLTGTKLVERIQKITTAARFAEQQPPPANEEKPSSTGTSGEKVQSALQQLAMRTRMRGNAA